MTVASTNATFARKVTAVFSTKVVAFGVAFFTSIVLSRILGPGGKGEYLAVIYVPGLLSALGVFGVPAAVNYFSARGHSILGLLRTGLILAALLSSVLIGGALLLMPWLEQSAFSAAPPQWLWLGLIAVPGALVATFANSILYGRQRTRTYSSLMVGQAVATFVLSVLFVAVLGFGVVGAIVASVMITWLFALRVITAVLRLSRTDSAGAPVPYRSLISYGLRIMPASITGYFNYRIDVFILQAVMVGASVQLGLYNMAFTMAELLFYVPDSVTMIFLPRVSGSTPESANASLPRVARLTILLTVLCGLALIPAAFLGVNLVLPAFVDCLPAFVVLLPGIVSMALVKVLTSYVAGRGRPGRVSVAAATALSVNVIANFLLIPRFGIVGASLASLISYTCQAAIMLVTVCRMSHLSPFAIILPGRTEFAVLWQGARRGVAALRSAAGRKLRRRRGGTGVAEGQES